MIQGHKVSLLAPGQWDEQVTISITVVKVDTSEDQQTFVSNTNKQKSYQKLPSKGDVSASAICYLWRFIYYIGRPSKASLATSVAYPVALISFYSLCCNMLTANDSDVVGCEHEHTLH